MHDKILTHSNGASQPVTLDFNDKQGTSVTNYFIGYYPHKPVHTCTRFATGYITRGGAKIRLHSNRYWRDRATGDLCQACYYEHVMRVCKQVVAEYTLGNTLVCTDDVTNLTLRRMRVKYSERRRQAENVHLGMSKTKIIPIPKCTDFVYLAIPQPDERVCLVHNDIALDHYPLPKRYDSLYNMLSYYIGAMPQKARIGTSKGFGQEWAGMKPRRSESEDIVQKVQFTPTAVLITALQPYRRNKTDYDIDLIVLLNLLDEYGVKYTLAHTAVDI